MAYESVFIACAHAGLGRQGGRQIHVVHQLVNDFDLFKWPKALRIVCFIGIQLGPRYSLHCVYYLHCSLATIGGCVGDTVRHLLLSTCTLVEALRRPFILFIFCAR